MILAVLLLWAVSPPAEAAPSPRLLDAFADAASGGGAGIQADDLVPLVFTSTTNAEPVNNSRTWVDVAGGVTSAVWSMIVVTNDTLTVTPASMALQTIQPEDGETALLTLALQPGWTLVSQVGAVDVMLRWDADAQRFQSAFMAFPFFSELKRLQPYEFGLDCTPALNGRWNGRRTAARWERCRRPCIPGGT